MNIALLRPLRALSLAAVISGLACTFSPQLLAADDLIQNGDFAASTDGWKVGAGQKVSVDTADKPAGASGSLRVEITEGKGSSLGEIGQEVKVGPNEVYRLSASVKSTTKKAGVLQVKLRVGKKEGERINIEIPAGGEWKEVSKDIATADSDNILVLCRYSQKAEAVGAVVQFANIKLTKLEGAEAQASLSAAADAKVKADAEKAADEAKALAANAALAVAELPSDKEPVAVPTFHSVGLYWKPEGGARDKACSVTYRAVGEADWKEGYPLWFDATEHEGLPMRSKEYRGSLVNLQSNTEYEVKLALASGESKSLKFKTWNEEFKIAKTVTITAEMAKTQPLIIKEGGSPESGYVQYVTAPGVVLDGQDSAFSNLQVDASWVMLKGITAQKADRHGIVLGDVTDIVIEGCDISGWGKIETDLEGFGQNMNSAVYSKSKALARVVIQGNKMHHPRSNSNSWEEDHTKEGKKGGPTTKHPMGPQCISFFGSRGQLVIRDNEFFSDPLHKFNDVMGEHKNFSFTGFPVRDSDIYNNRVANAYDDGMELEGANLNVRAWGNQVDDVYGAFGLATTSLGPIYVFRNVMHTSRKGPLAMNNSQGNRGSYFVKLGNEDKVWGHGAIFVFHNTLLQPPAPAGMEGVKTIGAQAGIVKTSDKKQQENIMSRNNILFLRQRDEGKKWNAYVDHQKEATNDFDYDLTNGSITAKEGSQKHGIDGVPTFDPAKAGTGALAEGSLGIDAGLVLPNFSDGYQGAAPDMGAVESPYKKGDQAAVATP